MADRTETTPQAWRDLLDALSLLARHPANERSPFNCAHDTLYVGADNEAFTGEELDQLYAWGFFINEEVGGFYSFRFGSA